MLATDSPYSYDWGEPAGELQMNRLSSRKKRLKFKTSGNLPIIHSREIYRRIYLKTNENKIGRCQHVTGRLELEITRILTDSICPKTSLPGTVSTPN